MGNPECIPQTLQKLNWQCYKGQKTHEHLVEYSTLGSIFTWTGVLSYVMFSKPSRNNPYTFVLVSCLGLNTGLAHFRRENTKTASRYSNMCKKISLAKGDYKECSSDYAESLARQKRDVDLDASPYAKMMYKWKTRDVIAHKKKN